MVGTSESFQLLLLVSYAQTENSWVSLYKWTISWNKNTVTEDYFTAYAGSSIRSVSEKEKFHWNFTVVLCRATR